MDPNSPHNRIMTVAYQIFSGIIGIMILCVMAYGGIYFLAGMNVTGADVVVGETLKKAADDAGQYAVPGLNNITNPAWESVKVYANEFMPEGTSNLGPLSINWDDITGGGDGQVVINGTPVSNVPSGGNPTQAAPTQVAGCTVPNTPSSLAALSAWNRGDWTGAVAQFNLVNTRDDCLAAALVPIFSPFEDAVRAMTQAIAAGDFASFKAAADAAIAMNPRYDDAYGALSCANVNGLFDSEELNATQAQQVMAGANVTVTAIDAEFYVEAIPTQDDKATITVSFGPTECGQYTLTRAGVNKLEAQFGLEEDVLMQVDASFTVPGAYKPANPVLPVQPGGYDQNGSPIGGAPVVSQTPPPAVIVPTLTSTPEPQGALPQNGGNVTCTYPGFATSQQYLTTYFGVDQGTIQSLNPGLWEQYAASVNETRQVILPAGTQCP